jgi:hypothetical protein
MEEGMKVIRKEILEMEKALKFILVEINMKESSRIIRLMEKGFISGETVKFMMVNGKWE